MPIYKKYKYLYLAQRLQEIVWWSLLQECYEVEGVVNYKPRRIVV